MKLTIKNTKPSLDQPAAVVVAVVAIAVAINVVNSAHLIATQQRPSALFILASVRVNLCFVW